MVGFDANAFLAAADDPRRWTLPRWRSGRTEPTLVAVAAGDAAERDDPSGVSSTGPALPAAVNSAVQNSSDDVRVARLPTG
jgi:hypothetical protein